MATPIPPSAVMQSGPPAQPPDMPSLSAMPFGQSAAPPEPGQVGSLPELFFNLEQQLKTVAKSVPSGVTAELDQIAQRLRAVLVKVLQSGAASESHVPTLGTEGSPSIASPAGPSRPDVV